MMKVSCTRVQQAHRLPVNSGQVAHKLNGLPIDQCNNVPWATLSPIEKASETKTNSKARWPTFPFIAGMFSARCSRSTGCLSKACAEFYCQRSEIVQVKIANLKTHIMLINQLIG